MAVWVLGNFMKISVFYYAAALGTAQWLKLSDYRPIVMPLGFITMLLSFWDLPNFTDLAHFISKTIPFYLTSVETLIPLLLLIVALLRTNKKGHS
jgi:spore germination protein KB